MHTSYEYPAIAVLTLEAIIELIENVTSLEPLKVPVPQLSLSEMEQEVMGQLEVSELLKNVSGSHVELPDDGEIDSAAAPTK